jgi:hypothetical protein
MALVATAPSTISGQKNGPEGLDDLDLPSKIGVIRAVRRS